MLKKIILLSSAIILSACATNPKNMTSEEFASNAKLTKGYNYTEIVGERIRPINHTEKNGLLVMKADSTLIMRVGEEQTSRLLLNLQFLENYQKYDYVRVSGENKKVTQRKETVRQCDDQCSITQYMYFELNSDELIKARKEGLVFSINRTEKSTDFIFKLPSNYIDGLLKRYEVEGKVVTPVVKAAPLIRKDLSKAVEMTQYWFEKISEEEQVTFSTWAIKNNKKETTLGEGSKNLEKLHYWYKEATKEEQKSLRSWAVESM